MTKEVYKVFGFDRIEVTLQTRPEKFLGADRALGRRRRRAAPLSGTRRDFR